MDSRRFRKDRSTEMVARARWLGWVMLMMFVLTQVASGMPPTARGTLFAGIFQPAAVVATRHDF
jgi:hypothetical protein